MHEACAQACAAAADLFGPAGPIAIIVVSVILAAWARVQLVRERGKTTAAKSEAEALRTAIVSLRPDALPAIEQSLRPPALPAVEIIKPKGDP